MTYVEAAKAFGVHRNMASAWHRAYLASGMDALKAKKRGRAKGAGKLNAQQAAQVCKLVVDHHPDQLKLPFALWTREAVRPTAVGAMAWALPLEVLHMEAALRQGQRAQRDDPARLLAVGLGAGRHRGLLHRASLRGLPAAGVHDDGRGYCGGVAQHGIPHAQGRGALGPARREAVPEGHGLRAALAAAPGVAHRRDVREPERDTTVESASRRDIT
ncbi:MAG: hypothetical protein KA184_12895 [Candidatus Hydrogenedentes bacterium]|nr:hypothetical protein [Candidatus Hydrogenedentota bacterium]